ncbi:MAG: spermidine synthase [Pseudorhizobium sp.]
MSSLFAELDYQVTPLGTLILRRRRDLSNGQDVFEIKLNDEFLMSSKFTASEEYLGRVPLKDLDGERLDVVVGGLGLGYTAVAALEDPRVDRLLVVEALQPVIDWHQSGLLPLGPVLSQDDRCRLVHGDFFALARHPEVGFNQDAPGAKVHAILLDIDHSPHELLNPSNASFYTENGLTLLAQHLVLNGLFALWSNNPPQPAFTARLKAVFGSAEAHDVVFDNPLQGNQARQGIYIARRQSGDAG